MSGYPTYQEFAGHCQGRLLVVSAVGIEKVGFSEQSRKLGARNCLGDLKKSFAELPVVIQFLQIPDE
jgi:hypothetical protein